MDGACTRDEVVMLGLVLAFVGTIAVVPGCHNVGARVVCELDPPAPVTKAVPAAAKPVVLASIARMRPTAASARSEPLPRPVRTSKPVAPPARPASPPSEEEVQHRLAALVSIGDCTGARTYAHSIGAARLADRTFSACAGLPDAPKLSYAIDVQPRPAPAATETNDAIIDQIPEMP